MLIRKTKNLLYDEINTQDYIYVLPGFETIKLFGNEYSDIKIRYNGEDYSVSEFNKYIGYDTDFTGAVIDYLNSTITIDGAEKTLYSKIKSDIELFNNGTEFRDILQKTFTDIRIAFVNPNINSNYSFKNSLIVDDPYAFISNSEYGDVKLSRISHIIVYGDANKVPNLYISKNKIQLIKKEIVPGVTVFIIPEYPFFKDNTKPASSDINKFFVFYQTINEMS